MRKIIPINSNTCNRKTYFDYNSAPKGKSVRPINILQSDLDKIEDQFYSQWNNAVDLRGLDPYVAFERTFRELEQDNVVILNATFKMDNSPYYIVVPVLDKVETHVIFHYLKAVTEDKLYKAKHKEFMCKTQLNVNMALSEIQKLSQYLISIVVNHLDSDYKLVQSGIDNSKFTKKYMDSKKPCLYLDLEKDPQVSYNRKCKECGYRNLCDIPEFSILEFDQGDNRWRKVDSIIKKYGNLLPNNLTEEDIDTLGEENGRRLVVNTNKDMDISYDYKYLKSFLSKLENGYINWDCETYSSMFPVPKYYANAQIMFSYFILEADKNNKIIDENSYIVQPTEDNFDELVHVLVKELNKNDLPICVHHKDFEIARLKDIGRVYPEYQKYVEGWIERIVDTEDIFKYGLSVKGMYSRSLKVVVPKIIGNGYDGLYIKDGSQCAEVYKRMFDNNTTDEKIMTELMKYNREDVVSQVGIVQFIIDLVAEIEEEMGDL